MRAERRWKMPSSGFHENSVFGEVLNFHMSSWKQFRLKYLIEWIILFAIPPIRRLVISLFSLKYYGKHALLELITLKNFKNPLGLPAVPRRDSANLLNSLLCKLLQKNFAALGFGKQQKKWQMLGNWIEIIYHKLLNVERTFFYYFYLFLTAC